MLSPYVYFGGKRTVARLVWERFGNVANFVEPFVGSGAVLLSEPYADTRTETCNDKNGMIANFWRAVQHDPAQVAHFADQPVNENNLHAIHVWLREHQDDLVRKLEGDPDYHDPKIAGRWCWGMSVWIGHGFCGPSGAGPWGVTVDANGVRRLERIGEGGEIKRQLVHLGDAGRGVSRQLVHLGNAGRGGAGDGLQGVLAWMQALSDRMARVRVCCGDWSRVCGDSVTVAHGLTGVFLDPPYSAEAGRDNNLYATEDLSVAHDCRRWAIERGDDPLMRIVLCGYDTEHDMPASWTAIPWKANGGYANQSSQTKANASREVLWCSPHCVDVRRPGLFEIAETEDVDDAESTPAPGA